ncbi:MAG: flavin reductase family protein [Candidatus Omnitrophota bacterium]|jgi:flavin reductase (DIM6/NTAB) family NADH-FMN oxidoreductase RutF
MKKFEAQPSEALYPAPVVLVSCVDQPTKKANIITIAWCGVVCSTPPLLSISIRPGRLSHKFIKETGDFVINIPSKEMLQKVDLCGVRSGRDTDKFKACNFTPAPGSKVISPIIVECPVNIECKLKHCVELGAHDMFIGEVVSVHVDENIVDKDGNIDYKKAAPFVYNQGEYWSLGEQIGTYGFSVK